MFRILPAAFRFDRGDPGGVTAPITISSPYQVIGHGPKEKITGFMITPESKNQACHPNAGLVR